MTPNNDIPLPDLSKFTPRDDELLQAWLDADSALNRLKEIHNVSPMELARWANQPHVRDLLDMIQLMAVRRANTHLAEARTQAISRLTAVTQSAYHSEVARRAADRLVRLRPFTPNTSATHPTTEPTTEPDDIISDSTDNYDRGRPKTEPPSENISIPPP